MAVTNFLQWNPTQSNQDSDAAYAADPLRTGGAQTDNIFTSILANKLFYQVTTFVAAFSNMLVNKGYSPADTNIGTLTALLATVQTAVDSQPALYVVPSSAAVAFDRAKGQYQQLSMTSDVTSSTIVNTQPGQIVGFIIITDGTAGRNFTWPTGNFVNPPPMTNLPANTTFIQEYVTRSDGFIFPKGPMVQYP